MPNTAVPRHSHHQTYDGSVSDTFTILPAAYFFDTYFGWSPLLDTEGLSPLMLPVVDADSEPCGVEQASRILSTSRSRPGLFSTHSDQGWLSEWSGLDHLPGSPVSGLSDDHSPFGQLPVSSPLGSIWSSSSVGSTPERGETARISRATSGASSPITIPDLSAVTIPSLLFPLSWIMIPQERYIHRAGGGRFPQSDDIIFSVGNALGFNMNDALFGCFTGLGGRDDPVLENADGPVTCRLLFPGYPTRKSSPIAVKNWKKKRGPIIRSKLAYEIARRVKQFLDASAALSINPSENPQWTIGEGPMRLEKMYLVRFTWVSKGSLQPEIWVDNS